MKPPWPRPLLTGLVVTVSCPVTHIDSPRGADVVALVATGTLVVVVGAFAAVVAGAVGVASPDRVPVAEPPPPQAPRTNAESPAAINVRTKGLPADMGTRAGSAPPGIEGVAPSASRWDRHMEPASQRAAPAQERRPWRPLVECSGINQPSPIPAKPAAIVAISAPATLMAKSMSLIVTVPVLRSNSCFDNESGSPGLRWR